MVVNTHSVEFTRDEIVDQLSEAAHRRGMSAAELIRSYRDGRLSDPGAVVDVVALVDLLDDDDPLLRERRRIA